MKIFKMEKKILKKPPSPQFPLNHIFLFLTFFFKVWNWVRDGCLTSSSCLFLCAWISRRYIGVIFRQWQKWKLFTSGGQLVFLIIYLHAVKWMTYWLDRKIWNSSITHIFLLFSGEDFTCLPLFRESPHLTKMRKRGSTLNSVVD